MKRINLFLIGLIICSGAVMAQPGPGRGNRQGNVSPETRAQRMTERMTKELSLNESQAEKIKAINLEFVSQMAPAEAPKDEAKKDKSAQTDRRQKRKEVWESRDKKLKEVLTPEQYSLYEKNNNERKNSNPRERMRNQP